MNARQPANHPADHPADIYHSVANHCKNIDQILALRRTSRNAAEGSKASAQFGFFSTHYAAQFEGEKIQNENWPYHTEYNYTYTGRPLGFHLLRADKITAANVREGNQLVLTGINHYLEGNFNTAERLFKEAMTKHGSSRAMEILAALSDCAGRIKQNFDVLPSIHSRQEDSIVREEIERAFSEPAISDASGALCFEVERSLNKKINNFIYAVKQTFRSEQGISLNNLAKLNENYSKRFGIEYLDDSGSALRFEAHVHAIPQSIKKQLDVAGYLGARSPDTDRPWYLHTESAQRLLKFGA